MKLLPNEEITTQDLIEYQEIAKERGIEGIVVFLRNSEGPFARKIFYVKDLRNSSINENTQKRRENKMRKVIRIHQKQKLQNDIKILKTLTINGVLVGYDTTLDYDSIPLPYNYLNNEEKKYYLTCVKNLLTDFHENDIVYGDVKSSNILINLKQRKASFCDLDNTQVGKYPIDIFREGISSFQDEHGLIPPEIDAYMHNYLLLSEYIECYCSKRTLRNMIKQGYFPNFLNEKSKAILNEMKDCEENHQYSGKYLLKYLKIEDL